MIVPATAITAASMPAFRPMVFIVVLSRRPSLPSPARGGG
jgi:hypothetical protein